MGILTTIKQAIGLKPIYSLYDLMSRQGRARPSDARSLVANHNKSWVYICASRNAETVAGISLKLYVRGGTAKYYSRRTLTRAEKRYLSQAIGKAVTDDVEEITEGHPLLDLLDHVNDEITRAELLEATVTYQELVGDAYWYLEPGALGMPGSIWVLMSQYVKVVRDSQARLVGYLYGKNEQTRVAIDAKDVIHFRYPNPNDPDYGYSPLEATFGAATLLEAEQEYMRTVYDRGGIPEVGIVVKGKVTEEERKRLYAEWEDKYQSKIRGRKAIVLEGEMDIKTLGYPPKDVGVQFMQQFSREEIAAAFGVPITMIQLNEASRAGAEAGNYQYMATTIMPKLRRIEEKLNERLCPLYDDRLFVAFENPLPEDKELRLKQIDTRISRGVTTINEERAIEGLEPVPWGDEQPQPAQPFTFAFEGGRREKHFRGTHECGEKQDGPMDRNQRRFAEAVTDHFVKVARVVDERMGQAG